MRTYIVKVTRIVELTMDETKFTPEFFAEFNSTISYKGGERGDIEWALSNHAEHLAWVHAAGLQDLEYVSLPPFIEGYGPASDMGIKARVTYDETDVLESK